MYSGQPPTRCPTPGHCPFEESRAPPASSTFHHYDSSPQSGCAAADPTAAEERGGELAVDKHAGAGVGNVGEAGLEAGEALVHNAARTGHGQGAATAQLHQLQPTAGAAAAAAVLGAAVVLGAVHADGCGRVPGIG